MIFGRRQPPDVAILAVVELSDRLASLSGAMHSVWLHGNWRYLTAQMTTEEREAAWAAVLAESFSLNGGAEVLDPDSPDWAWWRHE